MGQQIIRQPDGKYAVFSSVVDSFVAYDCTAEELEEYFVEEFRRENRWHIQSILRQLDTGMKPYHQFTMTWSEALKEHLKHCTDEQVNADIKAIRSDGTEGKEAR